MVKPFSYEDESITFFVGRPHFGRGSSFVEDAEGTRIVYTGDFRIEKTPVLEADVLVMEATYGSPSCKRPF
jgi:putative mRNA 3-end processing factor